MVDKTRAESKGHVVYFVDKNSAHRDEMNVVKKIYYFPDESCADKWKMTNACCYINGQWINIADGAVSHFKVPEKHRNYDYKRHFANLEKRMWNYAPYAYGIVFNKAGNII